MAKLGSLFSLSEGLIDNASLASIPSAPAEHEDAQPASSGQEEPSITASQQRSETDQGMTCLTCGIGIVPCDHVCSASESLYLSQRWLLLFLHERTVVAVVALSGLTQHETPLHACRIRTAGVCKRG